jgi:glycine dehydrogenase
MYAVYHGPEGLTHIARTVHRRAAVLAAGLRQLGFALQSQTFFDTVTVDAGSKQSEIVARALAEKINLRIGKGTLGIALDETTTPKDVEAVWRAFGGKLAYAEVEAGAREALPSELKRASAFLSHPVFNTHRSETELLRYMRKLSDRDLALDRAMIPLGSCTMKLNATSEMIPLTWPEFGALHPFAPADQAAGYHALFKRLEKWLCDITGYDAISLQPNSGAQGEYAGLLAIRGYHAARGEPHRKVCLIPSSAHGTNPASASMVGMEVVVVACDARGDVDVADLRTKAEQHSQNIFARSARSCMAMAGRSISTAPTSMPRSGCRGPAITAPTSAISTCTKPSAFRMAAAAPAWVRSASRRIWPRSCPAIRMPRARIPLRSDRYRRRRSARPRS